MPKSSQILKIARWVSIIVFLMWTYAAIHYTVMGFDPLLYHLAITSYIWNIGGSYDYFHLSIRHGPAMLWVGFPKTGELLQGVFWKLTGSIRGVVAPNIILLLIYSFVVRKVFRVPAALLIIGFFANPQISLAYLQSYIDLIAALSLSTSFFLLTRFLYVLETGVWIGKNLWSGALLMAISATCKHTMLLNSGILLAFLLCSLVLRPAANRMYRLYAGIIFIFIGLYIAGVSWTDLICYKNPFYPIQIRAGTSIIFHGPVEEYHESPNYPVSFMNLPPVLFFLSASELDWFIRQVPAYYNLESSLGDNAPYGSPARTGGWGGLLFLFLFVWIVTAALVYFLSYFRKPRKFSWPIDYLTHRKSFFFYVLTIGLPFLLIESCIPMAHELRYSNTIYLIMLPLAIKWLTANRSAARSGLFFFLILSGYYQLSTEFCHSIDQPWSFQYTGNSQIKHVKFTAFSKNRFYYIQSPLAFQYSYAYTKIRIHVSEEPSDRDITCPLNTKIEKILIPQFLFTGWDDFSANAAVPAQNVATMDILPTPFPAGDLSLKLTFGKIEGLHPISPPPAFLSINHQRPFELDPDSNHEMVILISKVVLKPGSPVHLEFSHLPVTIPRSFSITSFILSEPKGAGAK